MMRHWVPTNKKLQPQMHHETALCLQCQNEHETQAHIFYCSHPEAVKTREDAWKRFILTMKDSLATTPDIIDQWDHHGRAFLSLFPAPNHHKITPSSGQMQSLINKAVLEQQK